MSDKIYVIGHKSPDLDSIAGAIAYAAFLNVYTKTENYVPARAGEINAVTKFILNKFGFKTPELIENAAGKKLILVDHNEVSQSVDGRAEAKILAILDHHKINFSYDEPIYLDVRPWGSSNSIVYTLFKIIGQKPEKNLAGLMLSAVLDDTVITKSVTCTPRDKEIITELAALAEIKDWQSYGLEMFKIKSNVGKMTAAEIAKNDFKDFEFKAGKFGIGQIESVDLSEFNEREVEIATAMETIRSEGGYHSVLLVLTDIIKEGSRVLAATSDAAGISRALGAEFKDGQAYVPGLLSRKKQVTPGLTKIFDK